MGAGPVQRQQVRRRPAIVAETRPRERLCARAHFPANRSVQQHASEYAGATHVAMAAAAVGERQAVSAVRAVPSRARYRAAVSAPRQRDAPRATGRVDDTRYQVASPRVCLADDLTEQPLAVAVSVCFRLRCLLACLHVVWCRSCLSHEWLNARHYTPSPGCFPRGRSCATRRGARCSSLMGCVPRRGPRASASVRSRMSMFGCMTRC